mmetsp:Transcript_49738/g.88936  ORF Transcript_49738/g.88936 Transcript_49738/m.88936 type:complete len:251 (-) Transcript_49738:280-1032(-)
MPQGQRWQCDEVIEVGEDCDDACEAKSQPQVGSRVSSRLVQRFQGLSFGTMDDDTPHEASDGEYTDEEIIAPTISAVGIRNLRKSREQSGLSDNKQEDVIKVKRSKKPKPKAVDRRSAEEREQERQMRLLQWQQLRYILRLQRAFRIYLSSRKTGRRTEQRKWDMQRAYEEDNAGIIQRAWRGCMARRQLQVLRKQAFESHMGAADGEAARQMAQALDKMLEAKRVHSGSRQTPQGPWPLAPTQYTGPQS